MNVNVTITASTFSYRYCNSKTMTYSTSNGNGIKIIPGISTKMACIGLNPTEAEFDSAFSLSVRYERNGNQIRLYDGKGILNAILQIRKTVIPPTPTIPTIPTSSFPVGVWATSIIGNQTISIDVEITSTHILFTYCNSYSFPYSASGAKISFKAPSATKKYCADISPPESFVSSTFSSASSFTSSKNSLILYDSLGRVVVKLSAKKDSTVS